MGVPLPFILLIFLYVYYNSAFKDEQQRQIDRNDVTRGKQEEIVKNSFQPPPSRKELLRSSN